MNFTAFDKDGSWFKGNIHSHTVNSDGRFTPEQSVAMFKAHGYSFLAFSEHDLYTDFRSEFDTNDFIILPAVEASGYLLNSDGKRVKVHHLNGILGPAEMQREAPAGLFAHKQHIEPVSAKGTWNGAAVAQQITDNLHNHGCIVMYNHPVWSRVSPEEFIYTKGLWALEIFNYDTVNECALGYDTRDWDMMLEKGIKVFGVADDDNHNVTEFDDACGGYIMVQADELTHDAVLHAMMRDSYYSSSGPEIYNWGVKEDTVWVDCSACARVNFICGGPVNSGRTVLPSLAGGKLIHAEYRLRGGETYVRIDCVGFSGGTAWTNPFFF